MSLTLQSYVQHMLIFRSHGYCSHISKIRKYFDVTEIVITGPTYVNIQTLQILQCQTGPTYVNIRSHRYYIHRSKIHKYLYYTDIVVTSQRYVNIQGHGYCGSSTIRKYLDVTEFVVVGPTYVHISMSRILQSPIQHR